MQLRVIVEPTPPDNVIETKWDRLRGFEGYPDTKSLYDMFLFSNLKAVDLVLIEDGDYGVDESRCGMRDSYLCLRFSVIANEMGWLFGKLREGLVSKVQCFRWVLDATRDESEGGPYKELKVKEFSRKTRGKYKSSSGEYDAYLWAPLIGLRLVHIHAQNLRQSKPTLAPFGIL